MAQLLCFFQVTICRFSGGLFLAVLSLRVKIMHAFEQVKQFTADDAT